MARRVFPCKWWWEFMTRRVFPCWRGWGTCITLVVFLSHTYLCLYLDYYRFIYACYHICCCHIYAFYFIVIVISMPSICLLSLHLCSLSYLLFLHLCLLSRLLLFRLYLLPCLLLIFVFFYLICYYSIYAFYLDHYRYLYASTLFVTVIRVPSTLLLLLVICLLPSW